MFGDVQFARRIAEPGKHQHRCICATTRLRLPARARRTAPPVAAPPQRPSSQTSPNERVRSTRTPESDRDGSLRRSLFEQLVLLAPSGDLLREQPRRARPRRRARRVARPFLDTFGRTAPSAPRQYRCAVRLPHHRVPQVHRTPPRIVAIATKLGPRAGGWPHRTGRADFPHPALRLDFTRRLTRVRQCAAVRSRWTPSSPKIRSSGNCLVPR